MKLFNVGFLGASWCVLGLVGCSVLASAGDESFFAGEAGGATGDGGGSQIEPTLLPEPEPPGGVTQSDPVADPVIVAQCPDAWAVQNILTMSADDSNSMGSPGYAREMLRAKKAPDPALIRTYEFLNYYRPGYGPAKPGELAVYAGLMNGVMEGVYRVQVAVRSPEPIMPRRAASLTVVVDTSQSMAGQGIATAKAVVRSIAKSLAVNDRISILTLDDGAEPLLDGMPIDEPADIDAVVAKTDEIFVGKGADLQGALVRGYSLANAHLANGAMNRLVFITDGRTRPDAVNVGFIGEHAKKGEDNGIYLVGVGTGPAEGYNDALLNGLTDFGRGAYVYIDSEDEAQKMFTGRFQELMEISARDVEVALTMPHYMRLQHYYGEAQGTVGVAPPPQNLTAGGTMAFNMTVETCSPMILSPDDTLTMTVSWKTPIEKASRTMSMPFLIGDIKKDPGQPMMKSNAVIAYAEALKSLDTVRLEEALGVVEGAASLANDADLLEIEGLLRCHPAFKGKYPCP